MITSEDGDLEEKIIIKVPQGCYAEVLPNTPNNIAGLYTTGMGPCCHVIVSNKTTGHFILCHADHGTDLRHKKAGVPFWVKSVCPDRDYTNLTIEIGEVVDEARFSNKKNYYFNQISQSLSGILTAADIESKIFRKKAEYNYNIIL